MINTWSQCSLQAKFKYVDKLPDPSGSAAGFGSCVHHAAEHYIHNRDRQGCIDAFTEAWENPSTIGAEFEYWNRRQSFGGLRERGITLLEAWMDRFDREGRQVIAVEHPFKVPFGDHEISGRVDLLEYRMSGRGKNTLRVVDLKTGKTPFKEALRYNIQFSCYLYAVRQPEFWIGYPGEPEYPGLPDGAKLYERFKSEPKTGIWWSLMNDKEVDVGERTQHDFNRLYRVINEMERAVALEVFVPDISADNCSLCPYNEPCGLEPPDHDGRLVTIEPF